MSALPRYARRYGMLTLSVEPLFVSGHGEYPTTYVARVDRDVPAYSDSANVARLTIGRLSTERAYAAAFNRAHRLLINAIERGLDR